MTVATDVRMLQQGEDGSAPIEIANQASFELVEEMDGGDISFGNDKEQQSMTDIDTDAAEEVELAKNAVEDEYDRKKEDLFKDESAEVDVEGGANKDVSDLKDTAGEEDFTTTFPPAENTSTKSPAFLVEMLDFELTLSLDEPARRYLRASSHHRQTQSNLRGIVVKETLTDYLNAFYETELSERRDDGIDYSPLDEVYLNPDGQERIIVGKSSAGELYDRSYSSGYTGVAIFRQQYEEQRVPNEFSVQSIQLEGLNDESDELLQVLRNADAGGVTGLDKVTSISAKILTNEEKGSYSETTGQAQTQQKSSLDTVIIVAVVVAALSMVLLALSLFVAYRRQKRQSYYSTGASALSPRRARPIKSTRSLRSPSNKSWASPKSSIDEIPHGISGTLASSSSPTQRGEQIEIGLQDFDGSDSTNVPVEVVPSTREPYPDGVSVSAVSDVSSLGHVIMSAIQAYESNVDDVNSPDSQDTFVRRMSQHMVDGDEESVGIASIDDSCHLGYSLAGHTIDDGTKCGY